MKYLFLILFLVSSAFAQAPRERAPMSYAKAILNPAYQQEFTKQLPQKCFEFLLPIYSSGQNLKCNALNNSITPLSNVTISFDEETLDATFTFYHYTNSSAVVAIVSEQNKSVFERTNQLFEHMRLSNGPRQVFYVAADPFSSQSYGVNKVKVTLNPNAGVYSQTIKTSRDIENCQTELNERYQGFSNACSTFAFDQDRLGYMILEDSGVALLDYFGNALTNSDRPWFELIGPEWVENIEVKNNE